MNSGQGPDPFEEMPGPGIPGASGGGTGGGTGAVPGSAAGGASFAAAFPGGATSYGAAPSPYTMTPSPYGAGYGGYGGGYGTGYGAGYGGAYGAYGGGYGGYGGGGGAGWYGAARAGFARGPDGAGVLGGVQDAMARFARVSALVEDALRSLHLLFDALFGLGVSASAFSRELALLLQAKTGPAAFIARALRRLARLWRVLCLLVMSPVAGRYSPVAVALRVLGLVPSGEPAIAWDGDDAAWTPQGERADAAAETEAFQGAFDPSSL